MNMGIAKLSVQTYLAMEKCCQLRNVKLELRESATMVIIEVLVFGRKQIFQKGHGSQFWKILNVISALALNDLDNTEVNCKFEKKNLLTH